MDQNISSQTNIASTQSNLPFFESFTPFKNPTFLMNQSTTQPASTSAQLGSQETNGSNPSVMTSTQHSQKTPKNKKRKEKRKGQDKQSDKSKKQETSTKAGKEHPLKFWDCTGELKETPSVEQVKKIHIYDFDNTLFYSPCPNPNLFNDQTIGILTNTDMLSYGGWWSEPLIFRNMGEGWDTESKRQWESFWNQDVEDLLRLSYEQEDALAIVMTGRKSYLFADFIKEILASRNLHYNGLMLKKGNFDTTISYKTQVITDLLDYYENVEKVTIYDDRPSQLNGFQKCLNEYIEAVRPEMTYNLVQVAPEHKYLEPKTERRVIEELLEQHNEQVEKGKSKARMGKVALRRSFFYSAYLLEVDSKVELMNYILSKYNKLFTSELQNHLTFQTDFIPISRNKISRAVENELGSEPIIEWKVTGFGSWNDEMFAVKVQPASSHIKTKTLFDPPFLSFATTKKSTPLDEYVKITDWEPIEDDVRIKTQIGQVVKFKIVHDGENKKRKYPPS